MKSRPSYLDVQILEYDSKYELVTVIARSELELKHYYPGVFGVRKSPATGMWSGCITREPEEVKTI